MLLHSSLQRTAVSAEADILRHYHSVLTSKLGTRGVLSRARNASCGTGSLRFGSGRDGVGRQGRERQGTQRR